LNLPYSRHRCVANDRFSLATTTSRVTSWLTARRRQVRSPALSVLRRRATKTATRRRQAGVTEDDVASRRCSVRRWSRPSWRWCAPVSRSLLLSCSSSTSTGCTIAYASSNCSVQRNQVAGPTTLAAVLSTRCVHRSLESITTQRSCESKDVKNQCFCQGLKVRWLTNCKAFIIIIGCAVAPALC